MGNVFSDACGGVGVMGACDVPDADRDVIFHANPLSHIIIVTNAHLKSIYLSYIFFFDRQVNTQINIYICKSSLTC